MMDPLIRLAAAADIALNISHETGVLHALPLPPSGLAQFGLLVGSVYLLHEACGGMATMIGAIRVWWRHRRPK